jgi:hypothetical protein
MHSSAQTVRDCAAFAVLGTLVAVILVMAFATSSLVGGAAGLVAGLTAGAATGQALRRPAGRAIGRLVA